MRRDKNQFTIKTENYCHFKIKIFFWYHFVSQTTCIKFTYSEIFKTIISSDLYFLKKQKYYLNLRAKFM